MINKICLSALALLSAIDVFAGSYRPLDSETVKLYLFAHPDLADKLGGSFSDWKSREVGDGNLNLVFIIEGPNNGVVVKQALPYVRLVGESWPLPLSRSYFEYEALVEEAKVAKQYVPEIYYHDDPMALTVMEYLAPPHIILRKGLIQGITYPRMAQHIGEFLALTLFHTSDLYLSAAAKKEKIARFASNTAMCKITEDLVFDEPYFNAPMNHWTTPQLDDIAESFRKDTELKLASQEMKWRFLNHAEALIHGDLHTGSMMADQTDTRMIDAEFAYVGPMGFDVGAVIANLLLAYYAQPGLAESPGARDAYAQWVLEQIGMVWNTFAFDFKELWLARSEEAPGGDVYTVRLSADTPDLTLLAIDHRLKAIWEDSVGFAGTKMIRRILGLAHVADFESIADADTRAACERKALLFARDLLVNRANYFTPAAIIEGAMQQ